MAAYAELQIVYVGSKLQAVALSFSIHDIILPNSVIPVQ